MKNVIKWTFIVAAVTVIAAVGYGAWILLGKSVSNPMNDKCIGEIDVPIGYERVKGEDAEFAAWLRALPLKERGSDVMLYTGGKSRLQSLNYAVVDLPLLSNDEQCADVCMRLRAEYLYSHGRYGQIHFQNVGGKNMHYGGGASRKAFERYMRNVYGVASTYSLKHEMEHRELKDIQPGDVFVYAAGDHDLERKAHAKYGHAIMVVDVAENKLTGGKIFMLAEGNTPARDIHVLRNFQNPILSPWFSVDEDAESFLLSCFYYKCNELRHF